jgi:oxalate decarboxylase/phosphoglucose isomerase-like protein (cupin superfamily)
LCLEELELAIRIMPRDVTTCWNSTYDMLIFAVNYREAIQHITSDLKNGLRKYELMDDEWEIAEELKDMLKVRSLGT